MNTTCLVDEILEGALLSKGLYDHHRVLVRDVVHLRDGEEGGVLVCVCVCVPSQYIYMYLSRIR